MKTRQGFVSNSSSASFIINKAYLLPEQISKLLKYKNSDDNYDNWSITDEGDSIHGWTIMDNCEINRFFASIILDEKKVEWSE